MIRLFQRIAAFLESQKNKHLGNQFCYTRRIQPLFFRSEKMTATLTFYPVGNGDTTLIDFANGKKMLCDYANYYDSSNRFETRINLEEELRTNLRAVGRNDFDVVAFTHLDDDHIHRFSEFFWLEFASKYQGVGRTKIQTLWVPAAAITEEGCTDEARILRDEARHRLKQGRGIRVFSRPEKLRNWLAEQNIRLEDRLHLITDAGKVAPDFSITADGAEIFIHSPFAWRLNETDLEDRNNDSLCFQITFNEFGQSTRALFFGDCDHEMLSEIVIISASHDNSDRLSWNIMHTPHHSSYRSIGPDKGVDETEPVDKVKWLYEKMGSEGGILLSSCEPIPLKGSMEDENVQPPHRQANNYYRRVSELHHGQIRVTMEHPNKQTPKATIIEIGARGATLMKAVTAGFTTAAAAPARAG
jgi:beta-lactamase superfamily II metal-dependent hydrolase